MTKACKAYHADELVCSAVQEELRQRSLMIKPKQKYLNKSLFDNYSLEITGKDIGQITTARSSLPAGTAINIAFLGNESHEQRIQAAALIRQYGFEPVPIISARRLKSRQDRDALLAGLVSAARPMRFMLVGGDPISPAGPYQDSLDLIASDIVSPYAIRNVGIVGYPEGHPVIGRGALWSALQRKIDLLSGSGCAVEITTQYGFDADAIVDWIEQVRAVGITVPIRIGIPGPAAAKRLLRFANQFGAASSAKIVNKYGFSLEHGEEIVQPDRFVNRLFQRMNNHDLSTFQLHLYPFGGVGDVVEWVDRYSTHCIQ